MAWQAPSEARTNCTGLAARSVPPSTSGSSTLNVWVPVVTSTSVTPTSVVSASNDTAAADTSAAIASVRPSRTDFNVVMPAPLVGSEAARCLLSPLDRRAGAGGRPEAEVPKLAADDHVSSLSALPAPLPRGRVQHRYRPAALANWDLGPWAAGRARPYRGDVRARSGRAPWRQQVWNSTAFRNATGRRWRSTGVRWPCSPAG